MSKILSNMFAYCNGFTKRMLYLLIPRSVAIGKKMRLFKGASLSFYYKSHVLIGDNTRIDKDATVVCTNGANLIIGNLVGIGPENRIVCRFQITIGDNTIMGPNVLIYDHDHKYDSQNGVNKTEYNVDSIIIGKNCWIGAGTIILKGTTIGDNCVIGAGCIIKGAIPDGSRVIQRRNTVLL